MTDSTKTYLSEIEEEYKRGNATEHSYRPALKKLIESAERPFMPSMSRAGWNAVRRILKFRAAR
jgi:hypothetical protein